MPMGEGNLQHGPTFGEGHIRIMIRPCRIYPSTYSVTSSLNNRALLTMKFKRVCRKNTVQVYSTVSPKEGTYHNDSANYLQPSHSSYRPTLSLRCTPETIERKRRTR